MAKGAGARVGGMEEAVKVVALEGWRAAQREEGTGVAMAAAVMGEVAEKAPAARAQVVEAQLDLEGVGLWGEEAMVVAAVVAEEAVKSVLAAAVD